MNEITLSGERLNAASMRCKMRCSSLRLFTLTVQLQDGVVDFALELPGALESAGHPQALVSSHGSDDAVSHMG